MICIQDWSPTSSTSLLVIVGLNNNAPLGNKPPMAARDGWWGAMDYGKSCGGGYCDSVGRS